MALAAKQIEALLYSLHEKPPEAFAQDAQGHHKILDKLLRTAGYDGFDDALDAFMAEAQSTDQTTVFDLWDTVLLTQLDSQRLEGEAIKPAQAKAQTKRRKAQANAGRKAPPSPKQPGSDSSVFGLTNKLQDALRNDGQIRPDKAAKEAVLGTKNAAKSVGSLGRAGWLSMRVIGELGKTLHYGIKTGANGLAIAHNMVPATVGQKLVCASIALALSANSLFFERVAPPAHIAQQATLQAEDLHPSAFCQNPALWAEAGVLAAAWSVENYRANDPDNAFYQQAAIGALQQGMHPVAYWTLVGAETMFRDVIGTIANGMTQNLPATFLEKTGRHMEETHFYTSLAERINDGQASDHEVEMKRMIDLAMQEYRSRPDHYHDQVRADDPRVGPAVAFLKSLVFQPTIAAQIEAASVLREHPDLAAKNFTNSEVAFQELFFEQYDSHLPGPLGERMMDYAVENGYGSAGIHDTATMASMLRAFSRDVRPLSERTQQRMNGFFARVVAGNPGPFTGVSTMQGFYEGLRRYADTHVSRHASSSFARAANATHVTQLCVINPEALDNPQIAGVSPLGYAAMSAMHQITQATGITTADLQKGYEVVLDNTNEALEIFKRSAPAADPISQLIQQTRPTQ